MTSEVFSISIKLQYYKIITFEFLEQEFSFHIYMWKKIILLTLEFFQKKTAK